MEYGTHEVLLNRKGYYFKLYSWQHPERSSFREISPKVITAHKTTLHQLSKGPSKPVPMQSSRNQSAFAAALRNQSGSRQSVISNVHTSSDQVSNEATWSPSKQTLSKHQSSSANINSMKQSKQNVSSSASSTLEQSIDITRSSNESTTKKSEEEIYSDLQFM